MAGLYSNILGIAAVAALIFAATAGFTRARWRRIGAALAGGVLAAAVNIGWDIAAARFGWWHYTMSEGAVASLGLYVPVALVFGGAAGLIGWRMIRRWGTAGAVAFLAVYTVLGFVRDHAIATRGDVFVFGDGMAPHIADALGYLSLAITVQLAMLLLAGRPKSDALR